MNLPYQVQWVFVTDATLRRLASWLPLFTEIERTFGLQGAKLVGVERDAENPVGTMFLGERHITDTPPRTTELPVQGWLLTP